MSDYERIHHDAGITRLASPWAASWVALLGTEAASNRNNAGRAKTPGRALRRAAMLSVLVALFVGLLHGA